MEENQFKCSGDCLKCHPNQRAYCAAQFTYNTMRMVEQMQVSISSLSEKIEAIQNSEANVFDPTKETLTLSNIAQEGVGAKVEPQESIT